MPVRKSSPLHRVLGRLDALDTVNLTNLVQRLARERSLLEAVFDTVRDGILVVDREGFIQYANEAARKITGLRPADLARVSLFKFVPGLAQSLGVVAGEGASASASVVAREVELSYPEQRLVRLYLVPFREPGAAEGEARWAVILTDITKERLSTADLIESEKLNSIFLLAAGVAHEIGNPLNSMTIHLQLLERQVARLPEGASRKKMAESVRVCRDEISRLDGIIRHFLDAVRPQPPDLQEVNLVEVVEETLRFIGAELANRRVEVEVVSSDLRPVVNGDRQQLKQVLFNLAKNAMEAMPQGGRLSFRLRADDDAVHLLVADTGTGIRTDDLGKLFHPYHTTKPGGHGLGLMIVERILRAHGARIGVESREGTGTVFDLQFPLRHRRVRLLSNPAGEVAEGR